MKSFLTIYTISRAKCKRAAKYKSKHPNWVQRGCFWSRKAKSPDKLLNIYSEREKKSSTQLVHFHSLLRRRGNITKVLVRFFLNNRSKCCYFTLCNVSAFNFRERSLFQLFTSFFTWKSIKREKRITANTLSIPNTV